MVRLPLQCLLLGCWFAAVHPEPPACSEKQYPTESQCCNLCPPGQKLVSDCTAVTDTECVPCSEGEFLGTWSNERRCHPHRYCDPNLKLRVQSKGTLKTDTTCTCDEGRHCVDEVCENCAPHSSCPPGFGVKEIATGVSDTICEPCLVGFFSNVSSAYDKCHPWTSCEIKGLVELRAGTNKTDAVCGIRHRKRTLVVIPIVAALLLALLLVPVYFWKLPKVNCKVGHPWALALNLANCKEDGLTGAFMAVKPIQGLPCGQWGDSRTGCSASRPPSPIPGIQSSSHPLPQRQPSLSPERTSPQSCPGTMVKVSGVICCSFLASNTWGTTLGPCGGAPP
ncbi:PREDICTED: tumor necrosis factor receptor superfamily member 5 isoform X1 [Myotis davidii]|uniref:tumor necrosis factor receptor superfamily member 5 isoform X1 n=1 Tax=Myotis davidii TaxID=225400 RepID=UPI0003EBEDD3|nr:PREDICTED: tumor necrosis factor receptor superfamily member 5 isoform X1 [Myotis davidii]